MMVELPTAADAIDAFVDGVAFRTIGTNDLCHFMKGRTERQDKPLEDPYDPAIFHKIYGVIHHGVVNDVPTGVCGDMAGTVLGAMTLVGMYEVAGEDNPDTKIGPELSMLAMNIPKVKYGLMGVNAADLREVVRETLQLSDPTKKSFKLHDETQTIAHLKTRLKERGIDVDAIEERFNT
jgi:phosphotransferase system enzyme I (PtsI)